MAGVRPSVIAGTWYPGDPDVLKNTVEGYFSRVEDAPPEGEVVGLISPHAGYVYSGPTAAFAYRLVLGKSYDTVVVVSPMHRLAEHRYVVTEADSYETPLGRIPVDRSLVEALARRIAIGTVAFDDEHSLEIQLPFLQVALGDFNLVPLMVGHGDVNDVDDIVSALEAVLAGRSALLVASTDLHHIPDYEAVVRKDREVVRALETLGLGTIRDVLGRQDCSVCGRVPVSIVTDLAMRRGANRLVVLHQTNSGDVTGDRSAGQYTVGYLAAALMKP